AAYSDLEAEFATKGHGKKTDEPTSFTASLVTVDGRRVAQGRDFTSVGELKTTDVLHLDAEAGGLAQAGLLGQAHDVDRAAAVRERPHHLYAHRLGDAVPDRDQ